MGSKQINLLLICVYPIQPIQTQGDHLKKMSEQVIAIKHFLVPEHIKISEEEKDKLLQQHNISLKQLPQIYASDPALKGFDVKVDDVILIKRKSPVTTRADYYRAVIDG